MTADTTSYAPVLKEIIESKMEEAIYTHFPFYALVKKNEKMGGDHLRVPIRVEDVQGGSVDFANAQTAASGSSSKMSAFYVTHTLDYSLARIDGPLIRRSKGNEMAIVDATETEFDSAMQQLARSLHTKMHRSGYGELGQVTYTSGATFKMTNPDEIVNIQVGMRICFAATRASSVLDSTTAVTVTGVDEDNNVVTTDTTLSGMTTALATGHYVFRFGDRQNSATPARLALTGFTGWIPPSGSRPAASESFFQVDRSTIPSKLAGQYWAAGTTSPEETLIDMCHRVTRRGQKLTHAFVPPAFYRALVKQMQGRVTIPIVDIMATQKIGFKGLQVINADSEILVVPDIYCQADTIEGVNINTWELGSAGPAVQLLDEDELKLMRVNNADQYEVRFGFTGNLVCKNPAANINVTITPYT